MLIGLNHNTSVQQNPETTILAQQEKESPLQSHL